MTRPWLAHGVASVVSHYLMLWHAAFEHKRSSSRKEQRAVNVGRFYVWAASTPKLMKSSTLTGATTPSQRLLTHAHARLVYNFVCAQCRYDICCGRTIVPREDCQYLYLISLITQYMVDVCSHLARNTTASYGQHLNVYLDFFDAAPELDRDHAMGTAAMNLVCLANCTALGMLMLHRAITKGCVLTAFEDCVRL
jgi:hypothetical protein